MHRSSLVLTLLALGACGHDPTALAPAPESPAAPRLGPLNRPSFSHIDFGNGRWTVTTVLPWEVNGVGRATAVNNAGQAVGRQSGRAYRATPGGPATFFEAAADPRSINDAGDAVGSVSTAGSSTAVLWRASGERVDLSARAGAGPGSAVDINERGQIVGEAGGRGVIWEPDGRVVPIAPLPGTTLAHPTAINAAGTVVGYSDLGSFSGVRAFIWTPESGTQPLAAPAGARSAAYAINDAGVAVGSVVGEAVVWTTPGAYAPLPSGSSFADRAFAINNDGVIVGGNPQRPLVWTSLNADPIDVSRAACPTAGSEQVCRAIIGGGAGSINDRAQIAGTVDQEYYDSQANRGVFTGNGVVWSFNPTAPTPAGTPLVARHAGRCLDVPAGSRDWGTQLIIWDCHGEENQRFTYPAVGQTGEVRVYGGALCVDAASGNGEAGDPIIIWGCHGGANQQWTRVSAGELRGINGRCIDVIGIRTENGTPVALWDCNGQDNQRFDPRTGGALLARAPLSPATAPILLKR